MEGNVCNQQDGLAFGIELLEALEASLGKVAGGKIEASDHEVLGFQYLNWRIAIDAVFQRIDFLWLAFGQPPWRDIMVGAGR